MIMMGFQQGLVSCKLSQSFVFVEIQQQYQQHPSLANICIHPLPYDSFDV
jgi:hypothetical protein